MPTLFSRMSVRARPGAGQPNPNPAASEPAPPPGPTPRQHDAGAWLKAPRGIGIAVLLALPVWALAILLIRWLLR